MGAYLTTYKGKPRAVGNRVLVSDMYFGEQKTAGGLIINSDDGKVLISGTTKINIEER